MDERKAREDWEKLILEAIASQEREDIDFDWLEAELTDDAIWEWDEDQS